MAYYGARRTTHQGAAPKNYSPTLLLHCAAGIVQVWPPPLDSLLTGRLVRVTWHYLVFSRGDERWFVSVMGMTHPLVQGRPSCDQFKGGFLLFFYFQCYFCHVGLVYWCSAPQHQPGPFVGGEDPLKWNQINVFNNWYFWGSQLGV